MILNSLAKFKYICNRYCRFNGGVTDLYDIFPSSSEKCERLIRSCPISSARVISLGCPRVCRETLQTVQEIIKLRNLQKQLLVDLLQACKKTALARSETTLGS